MDRAAKLRKLDDFRRRVPHVSASALSAIIAELRDDPLEVHDRNSIRDARTGDRGHAVWNCFDISAN